MTRRSLAALFALALAVLGLIPGTAHAAEQIQTKTCVSAGVTWTVQATWGDRYTTWDGKDKIKLKVGWTANVGNYESSWTVQSFNSDGSTAQRYYAHGFYDFASGTRQQTFDIGDPIGASPRVSVSVGRWDDRQPECTPVVFELAPAEPALLFEDNFNEPAGTPANPDHWRDYCSAVNPRFAFGKITCGDNEVTDGQGHLVIPATPTAGSALFTEGKFRVTYGTINYRAKLPATPNSVCPAGTDPRVGCGYWPAFWSENNIADVPRFENDTLEYYSHHRNPSTANPNGDAAYSHSLLHDWTGRGTQLWGTGDSYCNLPGYPNLSDDYHTFSTTITPPTATSGVTITNYIDGQQCGGVARQDLHKDQWHYPPTPGYDGFYLIMNLAVGGAGGPTQVAPTTNGVLLVDRVWVLAA